LNPFHLAITFQRIATQQNLCRAVICWEKNKMFSLYLMLAKNKLEGLFGLSLVVENKKNFIVFDARKE
jgi:hypothetical protein